MVRVFFHGLELVVNDEGVTCFEFNNTTQPSFLLDIKVSHKE